METKGLSDIKCILFSSQYLNRDNLVSSYFIFIIGLDVMLDGELLISFLSF